MLAALGVITLPQSISRLLLSFGSQIDHPNLDPVRILDTSRKRRPEVAEMLQLTSKTRRTIKPHILRTSCLTLISNAHSRPAPLHNPARLYSTEKPDKVSSKPDLEDNKFKPAPGKQPSRALKSKPSKKRGGTPLNDFLKALETGTLNPGQEKQTTTTTTTTTKTAGKPKGKTTDGAQDGTREAAEGGSKKKKKKQAKDPKLNTSPAAVAKDPELMKRATAVLKKVLEKELRAEQEGAGLKTDKDKKKKQKSASTEMKPTKPRSPLRELRASGLRAFASSMSMITDQADFVQDKAAANTKNQTKATPAKPKQAKKVEDLQWPPPGKRLNVRRVDPNLIRMVPVHKEQPPVPGLSYGLDRVLFNPGVYHMQDPRSRVWNFDPYLARIMPIQEFDFNALKQYITSSKDTTLIDIAREAGKKYTGSTSSMTSTLAHFHYLLSSWRPITTTMMSQSFRTDSSNFTRIMRAPSAAFLHWKDGVYAIDADKEFDTANILSMLGKSMEKLLTLPKEDFEKYRKTKSHTLTEEERDSPESYHYTKLGDFMMRSQLDAYDPRIPGTGMFDLKTRAVISIRMDAKGFQKGLGYEIRHRQGNWESFEREYFDMIRSAFLKYSLQVRMGRMDGIFVAFHNTQRIFGFQYIPLTEMDHALHGSRDTNLGDKEFKLSLHLLNKVLDRATKKWPEQSLRLHIETRPTDPPIMYIFAKPVTPDEIEAIQGANKKIIEKFEREMMGLEPKAEKEAEAAAKKASEEAVEEATEEAVSEPEAPEKVTTADVWEDMVVKVEEALENEEHGVTSVREAIEQALQSSGLLEASAPEEARRYLDELLEALTSAESGKADESAADSAAEESESSVSAEAEETTDTKAEVVTEGEEEPTLKDLVLRLASQVKADRSRVAKGAENDASAAAADDSKLRKFETILSELIHKSREAEITSEGEQSAASTDGASAGTSKKTQEDHPEDEIAQLDETVHTRTNTSSVLKEESPELLGMILTIRNKVNGEYVERPEHLRRLDKWEVEYSLEDLPTLRAESIYKMVVQRRRATLDNGQDGERDKQWYEMFQGGLDKFTRKGRAYRRKEIKLGRTRPVHVYGMDKPLDWESVFGEGNEEGASYRWYGEEGELENGESGTIELSPEEVEEDDGSLPVEETEEAGDEVEVDVEAFTEEEKPEEKSEEKPEENSEEKTQEKSE